MSKTKIARPTFWLAIILLSAFQATTLAQGETSTIKGAIVGPDGEAAAGVKIVIRDGAAVPNQRTATATATGEFVFDSLAPGIYRISIEASGFKTVVLEDVSLAADEMQEFKFTLETGNPEETINITPEVPVASPPPPNI